MQVKTAQMRLKAAHVRVKKQHTFLRRYPNMMFVVIKYLAIKVTLSCFEVIYNLARQIFVQSGFL